MTSPQGSNYHSSGVQRRRFLSLTGAGVGASALAGCLIGGGGDDDELLIGGVHPYTGGFALVAQEFERGFEFGLEEVNDDGGMLDRDLVHDGVDTEMNASEAVTAATQFIERDDAIALTGPVSSDVGIRIADVAEEHEVPVVFNQVGSHAAISRDSRYTYRLGLLPAPTLAQAIANFIDGQELTTVRAIVADYEYGRAFETAMERVFPDDLDFELAVAPFMESDFTAYLRDFPDEFDALIATSHPTGAYSIFRQQQELDIETEYTLGVSEAKPAWDALGEAATDGYLATHQPYPYTDDYDEIGQRYHESTGEEFGVLASLGYVAAQLIATAIEDAGEADPVAVADAMGTVELDTLFAEPIRYTEWGELDRKRVVFSGFETGTPDYYPDGEYRLQEEFLSDELSGFDSDEWDI